jgi:hypothetical protein
MIELIKQSLLTDSKVSSMRVNCLILVLLACGTFFVVNFVAVIQAVATNGTIHIVDIPVAMAGLVGTALTMKAVQSFGKGDQTTTGEGK